MKHLTGARRGWFDLLLLGLAVATWATVPAAKADCVSWPAGLVGWWAGEGNANDSAGTNNGILQPGTSFSGGEVGQAFSFDGVSGYVRIPKAPGLDVGSQLTIEFWMKADPSNSMTDCCQGLVTSDFYEVAVGGGGPQTVGVIIVISTTSGASWASTGDANGGGAVISSGDWHHVAGTYDGTQLQLYIDGQPWGNPMPISGSISPMLANSFVAIGSEAGRTSCPACTTSRYFKGLLDEVSIYNRALSAAEIAGIYNAGASGKCTNIPPFFLTQPTNQTVVAGATVVFNATAAGPLPLSYQWQFNGTNVSGGTSNSLVLAAVQFGQAGTYTVQVTNAYGSTNSTDAVLTVNPPPPCAPAPAGLVGWWRAEGNAWDQLGTNHGSLQGGATFAAGQVGQAFSFNGTTAYVEIPRNPSLDVGAQFTIDFWMKADPSNPMTDCCQGLVTSDFYEVALGGGGPQTVGIIIGISTTSGASWATTGDANGGGAVISPGDWHHVAGTYDGTQLRLYIDGLPWGIPMPVSGSISPMLANSFVAIGSESGRTTCPSCASSRFFQGLIDEVDIFNRALSASEIATIYNASISGKCVTTNAPYITTQPASATVNPGTNLIFQAGAVGTMPLTSQWRLNGTNIPGATNLSLTLSNVQPSNAGSYSLTVSNPTASATSSNAILKVNVVFALGNGLPLTNAYNTFSGLVTVQLQNVYTNGLTFYTLDGSTPTFASTLYTGPFVVSHNAVLRALGYSADFFQSGQLDPATILIVPVYSLTAATSGGGSVAMNPVGGSYLSNAIVSVTATPASGWTFLQWLGDLAGTSPVGGVTMGGNRHVTAVFGTTLNTTAAGNGSVALNPPGGMYPYGTIVALTAEPQAGNYFGLWGNAASGNANPLYLAVTNANPTVSCLFASLPGGQVALAVTPNGHGKVAVNPRANVYTLGTGVTLTATPDPGQSFVSWTGDASGTNNPLSLTMNQSKMITANFTKRFGLTADAPLNGITDQGFRFALDGEFGGVYRIDSSTGMVNWLPLTTVTNPYGTVPVLDPAGASAPRKFYRAVQLQ